MVELTFSSPAVTIGLTLTLVSAAMAVVWLLWARATAATPGDPGSRPAQSRD